MAKMASVGINVLKGLFRAFRGGAITVGDATANVAKAIGRGGVRAGQGTVTVVKVLGTNLQKINLAVDALGLVTNIAEVIMQIADAFGLNDQDKKDLNLIKEKGQEVDQLLASINKSKNALDNFETELIIFSSYGTQITAEFTVMEEHIKAITSACEKLFDKQALLEKAAQYQIKGKTETEEQNLLDDIKKEFVPPGTARYVVEGVVIALSVGALIYDWKKGGSWKSYTPPQGSPRLNKIVKGFNMTINFLKQTCAPIINLCSTSYFIYDCCDKYKTREEVRDRIKKMKEGYERDIKALKLVFAGYKEGVDDKETFDRLKTMYLGESKQNLTDEQISFFQTGFDKMIELRKEVIKAKLQSMKDVCETVKKLVNKVVVGTDNTNLKNRLEEVEKLLEDANKKYENKGEDKDEAVGLSIIKGIDDTGKKMISVLHEANKITSATADDMQVKAMIVERVKTAKQSFNDQVNKQVFQFIVSGIASFVNSKSDNVKREWNEQRIEEEVKNQLQKQ
jgi:hypothetical protein